ncbi:MAG: hypothetical protein ACLGI2_04850 [Acidimicrobiia bacterium]
MRRTATVAVAAVPLAGYAGTAAAWGNRPLFYALVAEDRWFEMLQVVGYGVAAVGFAVLAALVRDRTRLGALAAVGGAVLFGIVIGEELSWGQRHWDVRLAAVERVNDQGDLTIHNVGAGLALSNLGLLAVAVAGTAAPFVHRMEAVRRRLPTVRGYRPPVWLAGWFGTAAAFTLARLTVLRTPPFNVAKLSEVAEISVAAGAAVMAVLAVRDALSLFHPAGPRGGGVRTTAAAPRARRQPEAAAQTPQGGWAPE